MKKDNRFLQIHKEGSELSVAKIVLLDKETGVQYLFVKSGYGAGLTPLLDRDGRPLLGHSWSVETDD